MRSSGSRRTKHLSTKLTQHRGHVAALLRLFFTNDRAILSHKSAYDPVKIENQSCERSHKLDGIRV